ncbi:MAG: Holliday junction branch migration protein RuvA [Planctomycetota bacterium]|jgi:Holliday junction DNA helicase RuvA|nr:Holliday junction branch migration protein RuvA [Planctomycetota bacterium]
MFNHIRGRLAHKTTTQIVVEVGGIGYEINIPLSALRRLPDVGQEVTIITHLIVREDDLRLVGFLSQEERDLFRRLIELSGVGPGMALQILSGMTPQDFLLAVERQDSESLRKIKGVGEKTAKRIILELKGAKTQLPPGLPLVPEGIPGEASAALIALGMPQNEAVARVNKIWEDNPNLTLEELIKLALR